MLGLLSRLGMPLSQERETTGGAHSRMGCVQKPSRPRPGSDNGLDPVFAPSLGNSSFPGQKQEKTQPSRQAKGKMQRKMVAVGGHAMKSRFPVSSAPRPESCLTDRRCFSKSLLGPSWRKAATASASKPLKHTTFLGYLLYRPAPPSSERASSGY